MEEIIQLQIESKDIKNGIRRKTGLCPIAISLTRHLKEQGMEDPDVGITSGYVRIKDTYYKMPINGKRFVQNFDRGKKVEPIKILLNTKLP